MPYVDAVQRIGCALAVWHIFAVDAAARGSFLAVEGHLEVPPGPPDDLPGVPGSLGSTMDPGRFRGQRQIPGRCRTTRGS